MDQRRIRVGINGTGFAGEYTARCYRLIPHQNGVQIELAGVTSGRPENAELFAKQHGVTRAFADHASLVAGGVDIDNICCANYAHGPYTIEAAAAGVPVIVLEKPPVIWPGHQQGREADAATRRHESMEYLAEVLDAVRQAGSRLLYAEDFIYVPGVQALVEVMEEATRHGQGKVLYQRGVCAHQGSHAPAYDTPSKSGGGALFNKACHPLGPALYVKQIEGLLRDGRPIRPKAVSAVALQVLKHQPEASRAHFRTMQNVDDFGRLTVLFEDETIAEVTGHDLSISGIRNEFSVIADFGQYDMRINPNDENELFLPNGAVAGNLLMREKLPTPQGTSFPRPNQFYSHGYVSEMADAVRCALAPERAPQSGPLVAWDTMAVLMAGYESAEQGGATVSLAPELAREFLPRELPDPTQCERVLLRQ
ncbi:MAG: Gfo/Idh/MocA family oxidoreductase [Planctomycetales bacterium]|nr:Gfo/Idh/MocA family oxidoreductase [Planctomycetales bacterium]